MIDTFSFMVQIVLALVCLPAFFLIVKTFFPARVERIRIAATDHSGRALLVGAVNAIFFFAVLSVLGPLVGMGPGEVVSVVIVVSLVVMWCFGMAGVVQLVGMRLVPDKEPLSRTIWGTIVLGLACVMPVIGWFGILVVTSLLGLGAFVLSFFSKSVS
jgi:hypothetical protein